MKRLVGKLSLAAVCASLYFPHASYALDAPPKPTSSPVVDQAGILSPQEEQQLSTTIEAARAKTGNQIGVLTIPSLQGDALEDYSIKVSRDWGIGTKERNSGVLLLAVINDRKLRIEVGYGLEGSLTDARSSQIIRNRIAPEFKAGKYYDGINSGIFGINAAIQNEVDPKLGSQTSSSQRGGFPWEFVLFGLFIVPSWLGSILARTKSWWAGGVLGALAGGGLGLYFGFLYTGILAIAGLTIIGLLFDRFVSANYVNRRSGGFIPSWWAGGSSLGGDDSDKWGGFGGGGFGGGGASGDW